MAELLPGTNEEVNPTCASGDGVKNSEPRRLGRTIRGFLAGPSTVARLRPDELVGRLRG